MRKSCGFAVFAGLLFRLSAYVCFGATLGLQEVGGIGGRSAIIGVIGGAIRSMGVFGGTIGGMGVFGGTIRGISMIGGTIGGMDSMRGVGGTTRTAAIVKLGEGGHLTKCEGLSVKA